MNITSESVNNVLVITVPNGTPFYVIIKYLSIHLAEWGKINTLWDIRDFYSPNINPLEMSKFIDQLSDKLETRRGAKSALLCNTGFEVNLYKQFIRVNRFNDFIEMKVFLSKDDAMRWLNT